MPPLITIAIPFLNAERTLAGAIQSVLAQTVRDWELLLIDDGSADGSQRIAEAVRHSRVRVLCDGTQRGLANRLNQVPKIARGQFIARMDADDLMHPLRLERQLAIFERYPEVEICGSAVYTIDTNGNVYGIRGETDDPVPTTIEPGFAHPTVMARAEWFRRHPYSESYARIEDLELWQRTGKQLCAARLRQPLLFYREGGNFRMGSYRKSCRSTAKLLLDQTASAPAVWRGVASCLVREAVYATAERVGASDWLVRSRSRPLSSTERAETEDALARIAGTQFLTVDRPTASPRVQ